MTEWTGTALHTLDELQAFDALRGFLEAYWERGGKQSEEIAALLGSLNRDRQGNHAPLDAAQWCDWRRAVEQVLSEVR